MDDIPESILELDVAQLRARLIEEGVNVGPIAPSAKTIFQRRLANAIAAKSGIVNRSKDVVDTSITKTETSKDFTKIDSSADAFFAIALPENIDPQLALEVTQLVFSDRNLALKTAKKVKGSRFKVFKSQKEAEEFSKLTAEHTFSSPMKVTKQDNYNKEKQEGTVNTESIPYKAPKPQDLVQVRRTIEKGDTKQFLDYVWNNPRYLISSGDTPVIYQEGPRYSAMHIAAIKNKPEICREILDTLENKQFIQQLYAQSLHTEESLASRINFLVDLYLNMPDKAGCESPLHMACKFGFDKVVEILAAHPKTDKQLKNKYGETPSEIICSRSYNALTSTKTRIAELLQGQYYVPLIRSLDNSTQPMIGQPWSPDLNKSPADHVTSIPSSQMSPRDPLMSIKACAGPMSPSCASNFHKKWTTPPSDSKEKAKLYLDTKRGDSEKGMERIGRYLAHEMQVPWIEHWDFLDSYVDLSTSEGLDALEDYFKKSVWHTFIRDFKDRHGLEELYLEEAGLSTPVKAASCDIVENAKSDENLIRTILAEEGGFEKDLNVSKDLSKVFDSCVADSNGNLGALENCIDFGIDKVNTQNASKSATEEDVSNPKDTSTKTFDSINPSNIDNQKRAEVDDICRPTVVDIGQSVNVIVSPMTSLSQSFAQLTVQDESWDDRVNNNSPVSPAVCNTTAVDDKETDNKMEESIVKDIGEADRKTGGNGYQNGVNVDREDNVSVRRNLEKNPDIKVTDEVIGQEGDCNKVFEKTDDENKQNIEEITFDNQISEKETIKPHDLGAESNKTAGADIDTSTQDKNELNTTDTPVNKIDTKSDKTAVVEGCEGARIKSGLEGRHVKGNDSHLATPDGKMSAVGRKHLLSERSDSTGSTGSYRTADSEEFYDCSVSSPYSESSGIGIHLMYKSALDTLIEEVERRNELLPDMAVAPVNMLVRLKDLPTNGLIKVDIVLYPTDDTVNQLLVYENVEVLSCDGGNLSDVSEGEVIDIVFTHKTSEVKWKAHFTREDNLPQPSYIHGTEPTQTDLDVFRALRDNKVLPDTHPNVFHWRLNLHRFCSDRHYRWQSPAKVKTIQHNLRQSTPNTTPQRKRPPTVPYGSPIGLECMDRRNLVTSGLRTALFPAIYE